MANTHPTWRYLGGLLVMLLVAACSDAGRLMIQLERPKDKVLDPLDDARLAKFSLRIIQGAAKTDQETFLNDGKELHVGNVPVGSPFDLRLAGKSSTGQMLGLGLVFNMQVAEEGDTTVAIKFRKPMGYVAGNHGLEILDTTAVSRDGVAKAPLTGISSVNSVAATPDGAWLLAVAGKSMVAFTTGDRVKWASVDLNSAGDTLGVSSDSRYAVVCHEAARKLSIVDLARLAEKKKEIKTVVLGGPPTALVFAQDRKTVKVLVDGIKVDGCGSSPINSTLVEVDMTTGAVKSKLGLSRPVADIAEDPRDRSLLMALPCTNALGQLSGNTAKTLPVKVPRIYDIAVTDANIVVFGTKSGASLAGQIVLFDLARSGFGNPKSKTFALPALVMWYDHAGSTGKLGWNLKLTKFDIFDIAVSPGGQRAVVLFNATFFSDIDAFGCKYNMNMTTSGHMLVDLNVNIAMYWHLDKIKFPQCNTCVHTTIGACSSWVRSGLQSSKTLNNPEFVPRGTTMLFGGN